MWLFGSTLLFSVAQYAAISSEDSDEVLAKERKMEEMGLSLVEKLQTQLRNFTRPTGVPGTKRTVAVTAALHQIVDIEQRKNQAMISGYFDLRWNMTRLRWKSEDFGGTEETFLTPELIWVPDIFLYHSAETAAFPLASKEHPIEVTHDGQVRVFIPFTATALCPINVKYFPFDEQECRFVFGSWSYTLKMLEFVVTDTQLNLHNFYDNQEWMLDKSNIRAGHTTYNFSSLGKSEHYSTIVLLLKVKRQSFYYIFNLVVPTTLVTLVAIIGFHTPQGAVTLRQSKSRLGITTLLSMGVMLLMVVDELPKFALASIPGNYGSFSDVPLLGIFYISLIVTISLGTCTSTIFLHMEQYAIHHPQFSDIPHCLRWLSFDWPVINNGKLFFHKDSRLNERKDSIRIKSSPIDPRTEIHQNERLLTGAEPKITVPQSFADDGDCMETYLSGKALSDAVHQLLAETKSIRQDFTERAWRIGRPMLAPHWYKIINRLERISLLTYLFIVFMSTLLLFFPSMGYYWY